jgi:tripartite-type tricarboxylate transporter receptor subunit TctC
MVGAVRGDGDITVSVISSAMSYVNSGDLRPLAVSGTERIWENVPTFAEIDFPALTPINLQRSIAGPPNIPADRLQILRDAFVAATSNPSFLEAAARANMQVSVLDGETAAAEVDTSFNLYNQYRNSLQNPN